ncbi:MAG: hypothetical protein J0L84_06395, partial [Verrucomicrobia bacterium]|nr:hypothetical protein [Verrucomicrobiota bacterium]
RLSWGPASVLSAAGTAVAFATTGTNFVETSPYRLNIYLRQVNDEVTTLASPQAFAAFHGPLTSLEDPVQISGDGRRVGFRWLDRHATLPIFDADLEGLLPFQSWPAASLFQFVESRMSPDGWRVGCVQGDSAGWFDFHRMNSVFSPFGTAGSVSVLRTPSQGDSMIVHQRSLAPGESGLFEVRPELGTRSLLVSGQEFGIGDAGVSADGAVAVFAGRLLQRGNPPEPRQVYVRAVHGSGVERISTGWDGGPANGDCRSPHISGDGRFVVFTSFASNLVAGDTNGFADVFVRDRHSGVIHCLSRRDDGTQENGHCAGVMISGDGSTAVFTTFGTRLIPGDASSAPTLVRVTVPQQAVLDGDGDGLPDVWEQDHLATLDQDGSGDSDQDGASHLDEYRARTAPADRASRLEMAGTRRLAGGMEVHWHGHAGVRYQLEARDSLQGAAPWVAVGEPVVGYEGLVHQRVDLTGPGSYLRVRVIPAQP